MCGLHAAGVEWVAGERIVFYFAFDQRRSAILVRIESLVWHGRGSVSGGIGLLNCIQFEKNNKKNYYYNYLLLDYYN